MPNDLTDLEKQHLIAIFQLNKFFAPGLDKLALRIAESISDEKQRDFSFLVLVDYLASWGNLVLASSIARTRLSGYHRAAALASIGSELAKANSLEAQDYLRDAEGLLDQIAGQDDRDTLQHRLSQAYAHLRAWEKATDLTSRIADTKLRALTLREIAESLWKIGEVERLNHVILDLRSTVGEVDRSERAEVLNELAQVLVGTGRVSEALEAWQAAVSFADYALDSSKLLLSICKNLVNFGNRQQARDTALLIKNDARREEALSLVGDGRQTDG